MIREHDWHGMPWYVLSVSYHTERGALSAFNALEAVGKRERGKLDLGIYRHGYVDDTTARSITVVSHRREGMAVAERVLARGSDLELHPANLDALIARRARVIAEALDAKARPGSYVIRRGRPAKVNADGSFDEWVGEG